MGVVSGATAEAPAPPSTSADHPDCEHKTLAGAKCTNAAVYRIAHVEDDGETIASCTDHVGALLTFPNSAPADAEERWEVTAI